MKKCGIFIFVFTFTVIICAFFLKSQYINFSKISKETKKLSESVSAFFNQKSLIEENEMLKQELSRKKSHDAETAILKKENDDLHRLLDLKKHQPIKTKICANIIKLNTLGEFTFTVDCGKNDGIAVGDVAIWGNALVGRITECFDNFSVVTPITAPDVNTGIKTTQSDAGFITGKSELYQKNMCKLSLFSESADVKTGDIITTSGLSDTYPENLVIGKIQKEEDTTVVKCEVDFFKIRTIFLG